MHEGLDQSETSLHAFSIARLGGRYDPVVNLRTLASAPEGANITKRLRHR
jgi:hypothetical protein